MDDLQKAGLIVTETRRDLLSTPLVIVEPNDSHLIFCVAGRTYLPMLKRSRSPIRARCQPAFTPKNI